VGLLLTAILAGTVLMSVLGGRHAERLGRRRLYAALFVGLALSGLAFGPARRRSDPRMQIGRWAC
jgi:MFS family permease